jgi:hypothetical protein
MPIMTIPASWSCRRRGSLGHPLDIIRTEFFDGLGFAAAELADGQRRWHRKKAAASSSNSALIRSNQQ